MAISKRKRFEVFKRDGFTCQYCGQRPPEVVLECDHIDPRANSGSDDELNLITSCADCNRGKSDKKLTDVRPWPDADLKYLEVQQELAESRRYLDAIYERDVLRNKVIEQLHRKWKFYLDCGFAPTDRQWGRWLAYYSPEEIEFAISRSSGKFAGGYFGEGMEAAENAIRYVSGVLKTAKRERQEYLCQ